MNARFWVSWYEPIPHGDYRPRKWPLPPAVPHYWCSGYAGDGDSAILCAVVNAPTEDAAKESIEAAGWTPGEWRFVEHVANDWMPPADRFPPELGPKPVAG